MPYQHIYLNVVVEVESSEEIPLTKGIDLAKKMIAETTHTEHGDQFVFLSVTEVTE